MKRTAAAEAACSMATYRSAEALRHPKASCTGLYGVLIAAALKRCATRRQAALREMRFDNNAGRRG